MRENMKKLFILVGILIFICLWLSGCQSSPAISPTAAITVASTIIAIEASLEQISQLEAQEDYEAALLSKPG
jgi:uncharacterized protein YcfL